MPLTIPDLVSTPELGLRLLANGPPHAHPITWVHVSELGDPTPFLTGGELLLTTGITVAIGDADTDRRAAEIDAYVRRLCEVGVVGLGFGVGLSHQDVPPELIAAGRRHGLPILEVPHSTPFIAISRAVSRALAADEYALVTKTFTAQQALTRAALSADGPQRLVGLLARQVAGWVILLDRTGATIAVSQGGTGEQLEVLRTEVAVLAAHRGSVGSGFSIGADTVSLQAVGAGPRGRAFLAVGRPGRLSVSERHLVNAAVMLLTIRLEQSSSTETERGCLRAAVLRLVLAGQVELARPIADTLGSALPTPPVTVLVAVGDRPPADQLIDANAVGDWPLLAEIDNTLVALLGSGLDGADLASRLVATSTAWVGLSDPSGYGAINAAHRQAGQAAEFGQRNSRPVTRFREIAMPGITALVGGSTATAFAESLLAPLVEHDRAGRGDLVNSLRVWLGHHGQWEPSASALGVHRHTLRHRMNTVEELLGRSLESPGVRSELWLALEMVDRPG